MRRTLLAAGLLLGMLGQARSAAAQPAYPHVGLQVSLAEDTDIGVGGRYENRMTGLFPGAPNLRFVGSFDYFFPDGALKYWEVNATVVHLFPGASPRVTPYLGGGLNIAHRSLVTDNTEVGLNLVGGLRLPGRFRPYLEGRIELDGGEQFVLTLGWLFW